MPDPKKQYEQTKEWMSHLMFMDELGLNSPDDRVQLIAALTATGEVYDHPEYACVWSFLIHFGFMDPGGNILPEWKRYWRNTGRRVWQAGGRDRWLGASDIAFPRDIGPQITEQATAAEQAAGERAAEDSAGEKGAAEE